MISSLLLILSRLFGLMSSGIVQGTQVRFLILRVAVVDPKHEFVTEQFVAHGFVARGFMFAFASFSIGSSRGSHGQCVPRASRLLLRRRHILAKNGRCQCKCVLELLALCTEFLYQMELSLCQTAAEV